MTPSHKAPSPSTDKVTDAVSVHVSPASCESSTLCPFTVVQDDSGVPDALEGACSLSEVHTHR